MPFIHDSEYILLMDLPTASGKHLSAEDMIKLRRAGIATAWLYGLDWQEYNLDPRSLEDRIARVRDAGMKVIVPLWERHPNTFPQEYYSRLATGLGEVSGRRREQILAPWNEKAQRLYNDTLRDVKARYQAEDVQIVSIYCRAGESVMPAQARYHDEAAKADWERCGYRGQPCYYNRESDALPHFRDHLSTGAGVRLGVPLSARQALPVVSPAPGVWQSAHP